MNEIEWRTCDDVREMFSALESGMGPYAENSRRMWTERKQWLFAAGCCRSIWHLLNDPRLQRGVEVGEQCADGYTDGQARAGLDVIGVKVAAGPRHLGMTPLNYEMYRRAILVNWLLSYSNLIHKRSTEVSLWLHTDLPYAAQVHVLREVLDIPSCPESIERERCLTPIVLELAEAIYQDRLWDQMPILADALEEAGCTSQRLLNHLRKTHSQVYLNAIKDADYCPYCPKCDSTLRMKKIMTLFWRCDCGAIHDERSNDLHLRGCWALDLILGKV